MSKIHEDTKAKKALSAIRAVVDAYFNGTITINSDNTCEPWERIYALADMMGLISNHVCDGLGIPTIQRQ